jgi:zinc protease
VILGAWGDFQASEMRAKIEKAFGAWQKGGHPKPETPPVDPGARNRTGVYAISKDDINQSTVVMGMLGGRRDDPDFFALDVMNNVLGGGMASRLFSQVRSEQGLAYDVFSSWNAEWDHPGIFAAVGSTKSETTVKIIRALKREIERLGQSPVTDDELVRAKDSILKGAAFDFDSTGKIVSRLMFYEYFGYPRDYLQRYLDGVRAVTQADVDRVARQYLKTDQFAVVVVGKEKDFDEPLSAVGKVTATDITIPKAKEK